MVIDHNFQTPRPVAEYMASMIPLSAHTVLEPTKGLGNIVDAIKRKRLFGFEITAPDDFFLLDPKLTFDAVVMNPPFSSKSAFLENAPTDIDIKGMKLGYHILFECMKKTDCVIALVPWLTIADSDVRLRALKSYGLKSLTPLPRKTFEYARIQTCVIELERGYAGKTLFKTDLI